MKPAVEWMSRPRRPNELFPSKRATRSSGSVTRSSVEPSTNSPGWRMNGSSPSISRSSVSPSWGCLTSMYGYRALWKTRNVRSTRTSTLDGWSSSASYGSIPMRPSAMSVAMVRSERTMRRFFHQCVGEGGESLQERLLFRLGERRELARQRRGRGEGQAQLARQFAHRPRVLAAYLGEQRHVPAAERGALDEP